MSLLSLPNEIVYDILGALSKDDVRQLLYVSKDFKNTFEKFYYASIRIDASNRNKWHKINLLLRTLLHRRDLARIVKSLDLSLNTSLVILPQFSARKLSAHWRGRDDFSCSEICDCRELLSTILDNGSWPVLDEEREKWVSFQDAEELLLPFLREFETVLCGHLDPEALVDRALQGDAEAAAASVLLLVQDNVLSLTLKEAILPRHSSEKEPERRFIDNLATGVLAQANNNAPGAVHIPSANTVDRTRMTFPSLRYLTLVDQPKTRSQWLKLQGLDALRSLDTELVQVNSISDQLSASKYPSHRFEICVRENSDVLFDSLFHISKRLHLLRITGDKSIGTSNTIERAVPELVSKVQTNNPNHLEHFYIDAYLRAGPLISLDFSPMLNLRFVTLPCRMLGKETDQCFSLPPNVETLCLLCGHWELGQGPDRVPSSTPPKEGCLIVSRLHEFGLYLEGRKSYPMESPIYSSLRAIKVILDMQKIDEWNTFFRIVASAQEMLGPRLVARTKGVQEIFLSCKIKLQWMKLLRAKGKSQFDRYTILDL